MPERRRAHVERNGRHRDARGRHSRRAHFLVTCRNPSTTQQLHATNPALYQEVTVKKEYLLGTYEAIDPVKSAAVTDEKSQADLQTATTAGKFSALGKMAMFPAFTFACYLALIFYFKSRGGYKPVQLNSK